MVRLLLLLLVSGLILGSCSSEDDGNHHLVGQWRFELDLGEQRLPFLVTMTDDSAGISMVVHNGTEQVKAALVEVKGDCLMVQMPVFNTAIHATLNSDSTLTGHYIDFSRQGDYRIPLKGYRGVSERFPKEQQPSVDVSGRWSVGFSPNTPDAYPAVGEFQQQGSLVTGTFLTTTGDFRFLEGVVAGDSLFLSGFDGSHAFLFQAHVEKDSMSGGFWSGNHWSERWEGVRNEEARLPDPENLTMLMPAYQRFEFTFPDLEGTMVSSREFSGKVTIVQIMGSWCANCRDETAYLIDLHERKSSEGLAVVALAFERGKDDAERKKNLRRLRDHMAVPYPLLLAGSSSKAEASAKFSMLNNVVSFPTTLFLDRKGRVRRIHTGFSGPGTGQHYIEFTSRTEELVNQLLEEKVVF